MTAAVVHVKDSTAVHIHPGKRSFVMAAVSKPV